MRKTIEDCLNIKLIDIIISNSKDREAITKVKIRPVMLKGELLFQCTEYRGTKVFHNNYDMNDMTSKIADEYLAGMFKQAVITTEEDIINILVSKKGKATIKKKKNKDAKCVECRDLDHNRTKKYIIEEGTKVPFMVDLGVMTEEGKIVRKKYDKFKQINRYLEFIEDILEELPKDREVKIIDFGCGKSYLTFAMYYYLKELKGYDIRIIGLDLKEDVINTCNSLRDRYGYDKLEFLMGDIASYEGTNEVDMVVTLHACDTATDYALYKAVKWGASVILSVPCCQHEVNKQIKNELLEPILGYGLIKERVSALITDALRANLLESQGYRTQILEFIDMEHTPKNILIRAVKGRDKVQVDGIDKVTEFFSINPTLVQLFDKNK